MVSEIVFDENLTLFDSSNIYSSQIRGETKRGGGGGAGGGA